MRFNPICSHLENAKNKESCLASKVLTVGYKDLGFDGILCVEAVGALFGQNLVDNLLVDAEDFDGVTLGQRCSASPQHKGGLKVGE